MHFYLKTLLTPAQCISIAIQCARRLVSCCNNAKLAAFEGNLLGDILANSRADTKLASRILAYRAPHPSYGKAIISIYEYKTYQNSTIASL